MSHLRVRLAMLLAVPALALGLTTAVFPAAAASAAVTSPGTAAAPSAISAVPVFAGHCSPLQDGQVRRATNGHLYICMYVRGFGGWFWTLYSNSCSAVLAPARPAAPLC